MDERGFTVLYETTSTSLWSYAARVSGHSDIADDVLQETFFRFIASAQATLPVDAARPYLFRIATNLLNDRWRRREEFSSQSIDVAANGTSNDNALDAGRLLAALTPRERQLLWLAYVEGMSHREIAGVTRLNALSVRVLLLRARRHAAHIMSQDGNNDENQ